MTSASKTEKTDIQAQIFDKIGKSDNSAVKLLLSQLKDCVDFTDENGMTPLQHAAYKGNLEVAQYLIDQGADVNHSQHMCNYSALHFAALSGNADLCHCLLQAGARVGAVNNVDRTASQLAAFVNNQNCVLVLNNFVAKSTIQYLLTMQNLQTEPYIPLLVDSLQKFTSSVNLHPVYLVQCLQKYPGLLDHLALVKKTLELLSKKEMKKGGNELMALKHHYLGCIVQEAQKTIDRQNPEKKSCEVVELTAKKLLKTNKEGVPEFQENFIKECVREFPNRECAIFRQVVMTLAGQDSPAALTVLNAAINGLRIFNEEEPSCFTCGSPKPAKKCSKCRAVQYCNRECQRLHWFMHKKACTRLAQAPVAPSTPAEKNTVVDTEEITHHLQNLMS